MGLLDHNNKNKNPDKNVNVKSKSMSREEAGFGTKNPKQIPSFDVNMRLNNHTRNAVLALSKVMGENETANSVISYLVDDYVKNMSNDKFSTYQELFDMSEQKDYLSAKLKNK